MWRCVAIPHAIHLVVHQIWIKTRLGHDVKGGPHRIELLEFSCWGTNWGTPLFHQRGIFSSFPWFSYDASSWKQTMWKTLKNFEVNTTTLLKKLAISIYMCCVRLFLIILLSGKKSWKYLYLPSYYVWKEICLESSAMEFFKVSMTLSYLVVSRVMEVPPKIVHFI